MISSGASRRGARAFPEATFPWLSAAMSAIEDYRTLFDEMEQRFAQDKDRVRRNELYPGQLSAAFHVHPVISILGGRGWGKSSALLTLIELIRKQNPQDLVLRPLDPHGFLPGDRMIFQFLAALKPYVEALEPLGLGDWPGRTDPCGLHWQTVDGDPDHSIKAQRGALQLLAKVSEQARATFTLPSDGYDNGIGGRFRQFDLEQGHDFARNLNELINLIARLHQQRGKPTQDHDVRSPLLVLPIDDADLVPNVLHDLLMFIRLITLPAPRLVVLIAMDERLAVDTLKDRYLRELFPNWLAAHHKKGQLLKRKDVARTLDELAVQYLTKFVPEDSRFFLREFTTEQALAFPLGDKQSPSEPDKKADIEESLPKAVKDALEQVQLDRFIALDWAILDSEKGDTSGRTFRHRSWSNYAGLISGNPRLLEQGYLALQQLFAGWRHTSAEQAPDEDQEHRRQAVLSTLGRIFVAAPHHDELGELKDALHVRRMGDRTVIVPKPRHRITVSFLPLSADRLLYVESPPVGEATEGPGTDVSASLDLWGLGFYDAVLDVSMEKEKGGISADDDQDPEDPQSPLVYAYLFLQEFRRKGMGAMELGRTLPGIAFDVIGDITPKIVVRDPNVMPALPVPYPLALRPVRYQKPTADHYFLPMPAWIYPIQWWIFNRYWEQVLEAAADLIKGKKTGDIPRLLLHQVCQCAVEIGRLDPLAGERTKGKGRGRRSPLGPATTKARPSLEYLQKAYLADIKEPNGNGVFATWIEHGLYRFFHVLERDGLGCPFRPLGFTAERIAEEIIDATATVLGDELDDPKAFSAAAMQVRSGDEQGRRSLLHERYLAKTQTRGMEPGTFGASYQQR